ncbi:MAG: NHLP bacteriocin export ABC transporter permease/ATPase subunit [Acidobacteria bacterium]|nr:NHLP bacteriocin export ABC transporter permease/ATPase subunit [Acidobacteriota bacterium]
MLDDLAKVWVVRSGAAAVFSTRLESGVPVGNRRFLFQVGIGELLFAISQPTARSGLIALAVDDLSLSELPIDDLTRFDLTKARSRLTAVEGWAARLCSLLGRASASASDEQLPEHGSLELIEGHVARPKAGRISWIRVDDGEAVLADQPERRVQPSREYIPLSSQIGLRSQSAIRLTVATGADLSSGPVVAEGLGALHRLIREHLEQADIEERNDEVNRFKQRRVAQERLTRSAMDGVAAVLKQRGTVPHRDTPILTAATLVGAALGVEIHPPAKSENLDRVKNPLDGIARASQLRHRRVLLRGEWWSDDCGPLVGYLEDGHRPVALLPGKRPGYEIVDPETLHRTPVTGETVQRLAPEAVMLYRPLPAGRLKPWQLVGFSLRGRGPDIAFLLGLSLIVTLIGMLTPMATALVMDTAIPDSDRRLLLELGLGLAAASFGVGLLSLAQSIVAIRLSTAADSATQTAVWDRLLGLKASFFKRFSSGDLLSRVSAVGEINQQLNGTTLGTMLASLMAALNLGLLLYYSSRLALIAVGLAIVTAIVTVVGGYTVRRFNLSLMELEGHFFGLVVQMIRSANKIRIAGAQERAFALWARKYAEQMTLVRKSQMAEDYVVVANQALPAISTMLLFWFGVQLLNGTGGEQLSIGMFLAFNAALGTFVAGTAALSNAVVDAMDVMAKSRRIRPILDEEAETGSAKADPGRLQGGVALSNVCFRYSADGPMILDCLSIHVDPGEFVALAGPSGSGKSTIFRLLLGFETPESGVVTFDQQELSGLDPTGVRRQMGVVLQSGVLNSGSILDNIGVGGVITMDEAWEAAEDSALADDIRAMPMGMHTMVSEGGGNLSGGQRQRLLIARTLVLRPRILLMDEATSALDNRTQEVVSKSLERRKVTRLVIAHRLSTIRSADRIYVMDHGRVAQAGSFEQLVEQEGVFRSLMARQQT